jgi:hypothetical protein
MLMTAAMVSTFIALALVRRHVPSALTPLSAADA